VSLDGGFKSLISRWFGEKKRKKEEDDGGKDSGDFIERDTLIKLNVKKGGQISSQHYRVLGIFDKSYNRWCVDFNKDKKSRFQSTGRCTVEGILEEIQTIGEDDGQNRSIRV
jgi:hypothetical protein